MKYTTVTVVDPKGVEYEAEVDADAEDQTLLADLVRDLRLPRVHDDGHSPIVYGINLIGGTRIKEGVTLLVYEIPPSAVKSIRRRG